MLKRKVKVGVVGCGGICKATYMNNMVNKFEIIDVVGCYDLIESRMDYMVALWDQEVRQPGGNCQRSGD